MSKKFTLADPGEGLQEAEILEVHVSAGDEVEDGDTVLTVETDKANTDIPAPFSGMVEEVKVAEGDTAEVGDVLMTYNDTGKATSDSKADDDAQGTADSDEDGGNAGENKEIKGERGGEESDTDATENQDEDEQPQHEKNVAMGDIEDDEGGEEATEESQGEEAAGAAGKNTPVPAAPSTRRLAREKNVNLDDIEPSGNEGRVTAEDVEVAAQKTQSEKQGSQSGKGSKRGGNALIPGATEAPALPDFSQWGAVERTPLRSIRRATAKNMARSWAQIPHVYHQDVADVTALDRFRREHEEAAEIDGGKFTLTVLVMKALASALKAFPRFSASLDVENQDIVLKHYCHIGLAVATDRGLLVPVVRDVDQKNLVQLSTETADIARKARDGNIERADMQGGCMTITNPGPMGGSSLTPIINHPQVAILGMAQAQWQPTIQGDGDNYTIEPRLQLPLILGFDHRVNDGADAAQFVSHLKNSLADPGSLLLNI